MLNLPMAFLAPQDIKTGNVLLGRNYVAKIGDVGLAQIQANAGGRLSNVQHGTFAWSVRISPSSLCS